MHAWLDHIRGLFRSRTEIYNDAYEGRQFDAIYFAMLVFACLIALLGLLLNSPAVIIGAMLISPLMGPILSCGLALTMADWPLGKKAARNVAFSVGETILIAVLATLLSPLKDATPEIVARTNPNLMDLLIAFFSGGAGTLALCSRKGALTILPGVAIATAVMPPLATTGYGISTGQWEIAGGAFMLFFTNLTAIIISADLVFMLTGFRAQQLSDVRDFTALIRNRFVIAGGVLVVLSIPLVRTLTHAAQQANFRKQVQTVLAEQVSHSEGRKLGAISLQLRGNELAVEAAVQTAKFIEPQEVKDWQTAIQARVRRPVNLDLQQLQLAHKEPSQEPRPEANKDYLAGGAIRPLGPAQRPPSVVKDLENVQGRIETSLNILLQPLGVQNLSINSVAAKPESGLLTDINAAVGEPITPDTWQVVAVAVSREIDSPLQLNGNLTVGEPITVRFHPRSLRLYSKDRLALSQFLSRWSLQPTISYRLVLGNSTNTALMNTRVTLLKRRSAKISVAVENSPEEDTVIVHAMQHLSAVMGAGDREGQVDKTSAKIE